MKTLGIVGGTGWTSTVEYYRLINHGVNEQLGGHQFPRLIIYSVNFGDIMAFNRSDDREGAYQLIEDATFRVVKAGAEGILLGANSLHQFARRLEEKIVVPIIHIGRVTAEYLRKAGMTDVGLLGTRFTMEEPFILNYLQAAGIRVMVPDELEREELNRIIYQELVRDIIRKRSKEIFLGVMKNLQKKGVRGIILGCTEIPLMIRQEDFSLPLFNTTEIHSRAAIDFITGTSE
jgi:aspartate racemase